MSPTGPSPTPARDPSAPSTLWLWLSVLPLGFGAWVPVVAGLRARRPAWTAFGIAMIAIWLVGFGLATGRDSDGNDFAGFLILVPWIGAVAFTFACRRTYALRAAVLRQTEVAEATVDLKQEQRERALALAAKDPAEARRVGVGRPDVAGASHGYVIDVNHVPVELLQTLPGIDAGTAARIVATREQVGLFSSVDDMGFVLDLPADVVPSLRALAVALPSV